MDPAKIFDDIVHQAPNVEFLNQIRLIKEATAKTAAAPATINMVNKGGTWVPSQGLADAILNWVKTNPWKTGLGAGALLGGGAVLKDTVSKRIGQETGGLDKDPVIRALSNPSKMTDAQKINTGVGAATGLAGGVGLYKLLGKVPGLKRKSLLKAILATAGGAGLGYAGWRAADNYQKA